MPVVRKSNFARSHSKIKQKEFPPGSGSKLLVIIAIALLLLIKHSLKKKYSEELLRKTLGLLGISFIGKET